MSKYVKNLISDDIRQRLSNVNDALLVNVIGLNANTNHKLRAELRAKKINVLVVKNSLAARAMAGTPLARMFDGVDGSAAVCWGGEDIVSLAKEITRVIANDQYKAFEARGGVMDGEQLSAAQVKEVSKWPSRQEQLSILIGQILSPGANLASQLESAGGALASQIEQVGKGKEDEAVSAESAPADAATPPAAAPEAAPQT
jgi:large subunit ribosomal protein L10